MQTHGLGNTAGPLTALLHSRKSNISSGNIYEGRNTTTPIIQSNPSESTKMDKNVSASSASTTKGRIPSSSPTLSKD